MFISVSFIVSLFSKRSVNLLNSFSRSDWLLSANCILLIVSLNFLIHSIPNNGVISVLSVIKISIFCLLFSYSTFTGIFPRNFTSFLFTSWYRFVIFCISIDFVILSSGGISDIDDPVSIMNSFGIPLIFSVVVKCLFVSSISLFLLCGGSSFRIHLMVRPIGSVHLRLVFSRFGCCLSSVYMLLRSALSCRICYS